MSQGVLRSKIPLKYSGAEKPKRVGKEKFNKMMEERKGQNQPAFCCAVPVGTTMWKCDGDCSDPDEACLPFWIGDPNDNDPEYIYWCQCAKPEWE